MRDETKRFRQANIAFMALTTVAIGVVVAMIALYLCVVWMGRLRDPDALWRVGLSWLPSVFYLWALWSLRSLFASLAGSGLQFQPALMKALSRIGVALMGGGMTTMVTGPLIGIIARPHHIMGTLPAFSVPGLLLVMLGGALVMLARMVKRAMALQAETQGLRDVLEGFI